MCRVDVALRAHNAAQDWWVDVLRAPAFDEEVTGQLPDEMRRMLSGAEQMDASARVSLARDLLAWSHNFLNICLKTRLKVDAQQYEKHLEPRTSCLKSAGMGLFTTRHIEKGETVCYYAGEVHDYSSKNRLEDQSYVLRIGPHAAFQDRDVFIDPSNCDFLACRYINDPLNDCLYNVAWHQTAKDAEHFRCAVVATKDIDEGDELFISYGPAYWNTSHITGQVLSQKAHEEEQRIRRQRSSN